MIKNIFVACGFTWNNKGDAALLMATAQALRVYNKDVNLSFSSFTPELDSSRYGEKVVRMPLDPSGRPSKLIHKLGKFSPYALKILLSCVLFYFKIWLVMRCFLSESLAYKLLGRFAPTVKEIVNSDIVLALPGGYLQATVWNDDFWLFHWLTLKMAKAAKKPIVIYAQSIGPFSGNHEKWAVDLLNDINVISVREEFSMNRLLNYGLPKDKLIIVPDAAFGLQVNEDLNDEFSILNNKLHQFPKPWFGVSVREHNFPGCIDQKSAMDIYIKEVALASDHLISCYGGTIIFVPQCIKSGGMDIEVSEQVLKKMKLNNNAYIIEDDISPLTLQNMYSQFELLIGTRMHANILTMCAGTPVVAIAYERKTNGIMSMLGLADYVIDIDKMGGELIPLVDRVYSDRYIIRDILKEKIFKIRNKALSTPLSIFAKL